MPRDLSSGGSRLSVREEIQSVCQAHSVRLAEELGGILEGVEEAGADRLAEFRKQADSELDETLAGVARSIRKVRAADEPTAVLTELVNSASQFCRRAALLLRSGDTLIGFRSAGEGLRPDLSKLADLSLQLASAPAIAHAVESRETVATKATQHDLSRALCSELGIGEGSPVTVVPLILRNTVLGVFLAEGPQVRSAAIEALVLTAEAWIEVLGSRQESKANEAWGKT